MSILTKGGAFDKIGFGLLILRSTCEEYRDQESQHGEKTKGLIVDRMSQIVNHISYIRFADSKIYDLRYAIYDLRCLKEKLDFANRRSSIKIIDNGVVDKKA